MNPPRSNTNGHAEAVAGRHRRVLMVSYGFPPTGGPGVQRSAKFAKYLPDCGWRPTIWAAQRVEHMPIDETLLHDLPPEVVVHRFAGPRQGGILRRMIGASANNGGLLSGIARRVDGRWSRWRAERVYPDAAAPWARASVKRLCQLAIRENIDVIYSTFSPASNHWLARTLKQRLGLPWVADFRDLWTDDYRYCETSAARRRADLELQSTILRSADAVIGVTERQTSILAGHVEGGSDKFITITNGYDPADFDGLDEASQRQRSRNGDSAFVLAHVGRLDRWRTDAHLFDGIRRFVTDLESRGHRLHCRIVGHAGSEVADHLRTTGATCSFTGYVNHRDAIGEMCDADVLLLCVPPGTNGRSVIPGKLFEYLASGRPILVVGPAGGECEKIVRSCNAGLTVGFDAGAIAGALRTRHDAWAGGEQRSGCAPDRLKAYARRTLTRQLAGVFNRVMAGDARSDREATVQMEDCLS